MGLTMAGIARYLARKRGYPKGERASFRERLHATRGAIWAILMPVMIIGGLVTGLFTPTEASVFAVVFSLIVGFCLWRFDRKQIHGMYDGKHQRYGGHFDAGWFRQRFARS